MSHTNTTPNFNLPQFVGTDKPAWLTDINGAFSAIDTAIKNADDKGTTAGTNASTALTSIGTLANLNTTAKTNLVNAINEVNTEVGTVSGVASNASAQATTANTNANTALTALTQLLNFETTDLTVSATNYSLNNATFLKCSKNGDGSLAKIYGRIRLGASNNSTVITTSDTGLRPETDITFNSTGIRVAKKSTGHVIFMFDWTLRTDGTITMTTDNNASAYPDGQDILFFADMLVIKNFGDTPTPE